MDTNVSYPPSLAELRRKSNVFVDICEKYVVGSREAAIMALTALIIKQHLLIEGLPGKGKTRFTKVLARAFGGTYWATQATPDTKPSAFRGYVVFHEGKFRVVRPPLGSCNLVLVDELNRTPPPTQNGLLQVTADGEVTAILQDVNPEDITPEMYTFPVPPIFTVVATQNPYDQEGTYPLTDAMVDRFVFKLSNFGQLTRQQREHLNSNPALSHNDILSEVPQVISIDEILEMRRRARELPISPRMVAFADWFFQCTIPGSAEMIKLGNDAPWIRPLLLAIKSGVESNRARSWLLQASCAAALFFPEPGVGSPTGFVTPTHFLNLARYVVPQRMLVHPQAAHRRDSRIGDWQAMVENANLGSWQDAGDPKSQQAAIVKHIAQNRPITPDLICAAIGACLDPTTLDSARYRL
jgi:MoxR-like ATPase